MVGTGTKNMTENNNQISYFFTDLYSLEDRFGFPVLDHAFEGIMINVDKIQYDSQKLTFKLLVSYSFCKEFIECFTKIEWSLVLTIDDIEHQSGISFNLQDPSKRYKGPTTPGYTNKSVDSGSNNGFYERYIEVPISISCPNSSLELSHFLTVSLHEYKSNRIAIGAITQKTVSYVNGMQSNLNISEENI